MKRNHKCRRALAKGVALLGLIIVLLVAEATTALAATRTVCFEMFIRDDARFNCLGDGTTGARRSCSPASTWQYAVGYQVELWDKDAGPASNDEFIGSWRLGAAGVQCATFEWENAPYYLFETNPDVYVLLKNEARAPAGGFAVRIVDQNGNGYPSASWRNGPVANQIVGSPMSV